MAGATIKHSLYQRNNDVTVTFYVKEVDAAAAQVQFLPQALNIKLPQLSGQVVEEKYSLPTPIEPSKCSSKILKMKVELKLVCAVHGKWPEQLTPASAEAANTAASGDGVSQEEFIKKYPTSGKTYHDWDKIEAEAKKVEAEEKKEGDDGVNALFQQIFKDGTAEQQKAMVKSFTESGGTVLSTNWDEVKQSKVEVQPPDGMEFKKWDS